MKKVLALLSIVALTSCGNGSTSTEVTTDSTATVVDSTLVAADSTAAPVVDTVKAEESK